VAFIYFQRREIMKKLFGLMIIVGLLLSGCSTSVDESNLLVVGMECAYAPFNWTQVESSETAFLINNEEGTGYCDGYDVQIAKAIADELGKDLLVKKIAWEGLIDGLNNGEIDMIVAGMTDTAERRESVSFSLPYYQSDLVLIVRNDSSYTSATNLKDFSESTVVAQKGTFHDTVVDQIPAVNHMTPLGSFALLTNSVIIGEADAMVSEYPVALSIVGTNPDLKIIVFEAGNGFSTSFEDTTVSVAVRKDDTDLLNTINAVLNGLTEETRSEWMKDALERQPEGE
jgi:putative lysine transport system substrate-binding protein